MSGRFSSHPPPAIILREQDMIKYRAMKRKMSNQEAEQQKMSQYQPIKRQQANEEAERLQMEFSPLRIQGQSISSQSRPYDSSVDQNTNRGNQRRVRESSAVLRSPPRLQQFFPQNCRNQINQKPLSNSEQLVISLRQSTLIEQSIQQELKKQQKEHDLMMKDQRKQVKMEKDRADFQQKRANEEEKRANEEKKRANEEKKRADQLEDKLKTFMEEQKVNEDLKKEDPIEEIILDQQLTSINVDKNKTIEEHNQSQLTASKNNSDKKELDNSLIISPVKEEEHLLPALGNLTYQGRIFQDALKPKKKIFSQIRQQRPNTNNIS